MLPTELEKRRRNLILKKAIPNKFLSLIDFLKKIMQYVYLLKCADKTTYTGCTQNIEERLKRHAKKEVLYTSSRLPVKLVTFIAFNEKHKAFAFEKYLKSGSGKAFSNKRFL